MSANNRSMLIEHWLPIAEIGAESLRDASAAKKPPLNRLHVWWARRPLTVSRAAILGSVLPQWSPDWPAKLHEQFPTEEVYHQWFLRLLGIVGDPVAGRKLIGYAKERGIKLKTNPYGYPRAFTVNPDEGQTKTLQNLIEYAWGTRDLTVMDPMAGGGSIPFEALRYGFTTFANELNPVASVILKATIEYPSKFGSDLATDIEKYGRIAAKRIEERLTQYFPSLPGESTFAYLWARTVACPYTGKPVPLAPNWWLRKGERAAAIQPVFDARLPVAEFKVVMGDAACERAKPDRGTIRLGQGISPWAGNQPIDGEHIKGEAQAGRMGQQLFCVCTKKNGDLNFRTPTPDDLMATREAENECSRRLPGWQASGCVPTEGIADPTNYARGHRLYGMTRWADLFAPRQLLATATFVEVVKDLHASMIGDLGTDRGIAVATYLAMAIDKAVDYNSRQCSWHASRQVVRNTFTQHNFSMVWSPAEFDAARNLVPWVIKQVCDAYRGIVKLANPASVFAAAPPVQKSAIHRGSATSLVRIPSASIGHVCVDPPYYDNVMYAELSDFFYVWLKRTLGASHPEIFAEELTNKDDEAVSNVARFQGLGSKRKELALADYERKMAAVFREAHRILQDDGVLTVMFTHKRVEAWDTLATSLIGAGFAIKASWPVHTESEHSVHQAKRNAASSTILLVCRKREASAEPVWWDDLKNTVRQTARAKAEEFEKLGIRGVDLYISTFGPTLSIISEHWPVLTGDVDPKTGQPMPLRPDVALDLARGEVVNLRKRGLLLGRTVQFDPITDWYLMAWDAFKAEQFPADEARKLAIALGLNVEDDLVKTKRLITKKQDFVALQPPPARRKKGMVDPEMTAFDCQIDAVHTAMLVLEEDGTKACERFLRQARLLDDGTFKACLQALVNAVPRTMKKGKFVRAEAALLDKLRDAFFPDLEVPPEEVPPPLPAQQAFGFAKAAEDVEEYGEEAEDEEGDEE